MLFSKPYAGLFVVGVPLYPSDETLFAQWFEDSKMTPEKVFVYLALKKYVQQGCFTQPGQFLVTMRRRRFGLQIRGHIYKFPLDADPMRIAAYLAVIGIHLEGEDDDESAVPEHDGPGDGPGDHRWAYQHTTFGGYGHPN